MITQEITTGRGMRLRLIHFDQEEESFWKSLITGLKHFLGLDKRKKALGDRHKALGRKR